MNRFYDEFWVNTNGYGRYGCNGNTVLRKLRDQRIDSRTPAPYHNSQRPTSSQNMAQSRNLEVGDIVNVELICLGYKDDPTTRRPQPTHGPRYGIIIDHDGEEGPYTIIPICTAAPRTMQSNPINGGGEDAVLTTHPSLRGKLLFPPTASPWAPFALRRLAQSMIEPFRFPILATIGAIGNSDAELRHI
jgi:hypothetical protein